MQIPTDEKTTPKGTLFEHLATNHPWLAEELKKNEMLFLYASVLYAAEDAINLAFSFFRLGFAMNDAFLEHHDASSVEFGHFEATPEGLAITIAGSAFLFLFSSLGTYFADADPDKDGLFFYALGVFWSYLRDMLKAMKWAYKGFRSALLLVLMLSGHTALLYHILFPLTIVVGILAALNRVAIRYIRNRRKDMQKENEGLAADILATFHALTVMKTLPDEKELARYKHALIAVQTAEDYDVFYVKEITEPNPNEYGTVTKLVLEPFNLDQTQRQQFKAELQQAQNEILCQQLSHLLPQKSETTLHFVQSLSSIKSGAENGMGIQAGASYQNSVVYLIDPQIPIGERVYVIDEHGDAKLDVHLSRQFEVHVQHHQQNDILFGLPVTQLHRIPTLNNTLLEGLRRGYTYEEWLKKYKDKEAKKQNPLEAFLCYILVFFSTMVDSTYFYIGMLFVTALNPHLFFAMLGMSSVLFITCLLTRIYEEYDYQRKFRRTQILVEMAKSEAECRFIEVELERWRHSSQSNEYQDNLKKLLFQIENYEKLHLQREKELVLGFWSALMLGLTCGLGFQGVISALMFLVIAIFTLTSTACPPVLVFSFMSVGIACFLFSAIQFVVSYRQYDTKIKQQQQVIKNEDTAYLQHYLTELKDQGVLKVDKKEDFTSWDWKKAYDNLSGDPHLQKNLLLLVKQNIDRRAINPIQKFDLLGWWEVFRLLFSGIVKADKTYGEFADPHHETWVMFAVALAFSILMGIIFALRAIAKMFPVSSKKENPSTVPLQETTYPKPSKQSRGNLSQCFSCGFWRHEESGTGSKHSSRDSISADFEQNTSHSFVGLSLSPNSGDG